ncbi:hypothetical protein GEMRC1_011748 [Eukaryota sp. GEM-RC1]
MTDCPVCFNSYNLTDLQPLIICEESHTVCASCSSLLDSCPFCRSECNSIKHPNYALKHVIEAMKCGDLCPQISCEQINLRELLGQGGFASVFPAEWFGSTIAVKKILLTEKGET